MSMIKFKFFFSLSAPRRPGARRPLGPTHLAPLLVGADVLGGPLHPPGTPHVARRSSTPRRGRAAGDVGPYHTSHPTHSAPTLARRALYLRRPRCVALNRRPRRPLCTARFGHVPAIVISFKLVIFCGIVICLRDCCLLAGLLSVCGTVICFWDSWDFTSERSDVKSCEALVKPRPRLSRP